MSATKAPLHVWDTNILMDLLLERGSSQATLLLGLAEKKQIELVIPEYVISEFRGTANQVIQEGIKLTIPEIRKFASDWGRAARLEEGVKKIQEGASCVAQGLEDTLLRINDIESRIRTLSQIEDYTSDIHVKAELRFLRGEPPDKPRRGIKDCRIFETVLKIAEDHKGDVRKKYFVTMDTDFNNQRIRDELRLHDFQLSSELGRLYGEIVSPPKSSTPRSITPPTYSPF